MRVIAGVAKSLQLSIPLHGDVRPTIDRYKETVFNIIMEHVPECKMLDIFSGSGSMGIEALSRGGKRSYFIERDKEAMDCIKHNLKFTKLIEKAELLEYDYKVSLAMLGDKEEKFDIIYLDPPFNDNLEKEVIDLIKTYDLLEENGIIICESSQKTDMDFLKEDKYWQFSKKKIFKSCQFNFFKKY